MHRLLRKDRSKIDACVANENYSNVEKRNILEVKMENLKTPLDKKGRKLEKLTKVQRFYSEFNSDRSSSSSSSSLYVDDRIFTFETKEIPNNKFNDKLSTKMKDANFSAKTSPKTIDKKKSSEACTLIPPVSPGLSANQDLKDKALDIIYQKKIKELKSKKHSCK